MHNCLIYLYVFTVGRVFDYSNDIKVQLIIYCEHRYIIYGNNPSRNAGFCIAPKENYNEAILSNIAAYCPLLDTLYCLDETTYCTVQILTHIPL